MKRAAADSSLATATSRERCRHESDSSMTGRRGTSSTAMVQLTPVAIGELAVRLAPKAAVEPPVLQAGAEQGKAAASSRPAQRNMVIPCFSQHGRERVFSELSLFFELHPSRFFLVDLRPEHPELRASIGEPIGDSAGSQVIVFEGAPHHLPAICGLLRAHLLIGVQTELALLDGALLPEALSALLPLSNAVLIESHLFDHLGGSGWGDGRAALFAELLNSELTTIDSSWLRLSALREEIRRAFDQRGLLDPSTIEIEYIPTVSYRGDPVSGLPTVAILLAGWCCSRLGAHRFVPTSVGGVAEFENGDKISISFVRAELKDHALGSASEGRGAEVVGLRLRCRNGGIKIHISNGVLRTEVDAEVKSHSERSMEHESDTDRWRRYFLIGESVTNYRDSVMIALPLFH